QEVEDSRVLTGPRRHRRVDQSGGEDIDADAVWRITSSSQPAQGNDTALGSRIGTGVEVARRWGQGEDTRHGQDDAALPLAEKMPDRVTVGEKNALQISVEGGLPAVVGAFVQRPVAVAPTADPRDVVEHVETTEEGQGFGEQAFDLDG